MINDDEYNNKVFQQYQDKYKDFKTSFIILLGFAVIFFFIILLPHFSLSLDNNSLSERITKLKHDISMLDIAKNENKEFGSNVSKFKDGLKQFVTNPKNFIDVGTVQQSDDLKNRKICIDNSTEKMAECKIINYILGSLNLTAIINPINNISYESSKSINASSLVADLKSLDESLKNISFNNLELIKTTEGKDVLNDTFSKEIVKKLNPNVIEEMKGSLMNSSSTLTEQSNKAKELDKIVTERISQINTPIGQLPITLNEAISIFPLSLGIGSLISTSFLLECLKLRDKIRNYYNKQGLSDKDIASIASPWIDKIESKKNRMVKFLILIIPFVIFIISSILIVYEWIVLDKLNKTADIIWTFPGGNYINFYIFSISYIISLVFFIYGYKKLIVYL